MHNLLYANNIVHRKLLCQSTLSKCVLVNFRGTCKIHRTECLWFYLPLNMNSFVSIIQKSYIRVYSGWYTLAKRTVGGKMVFCWCRCCCLSSEGKHIGIQNQCKFYSYFMIRWFEFDIREEQKMCTISGSLSLTLLTTMLWWKWDFSYANNEKKSVSSGFLFHFNDTNLRKVSNRIEREKKISRRSTCCQPPLSTSSDTFRDNLGKI